MEGSGGDSDSTRGVAVQPESMQDTLLAQAILRSRQSLDRFLGVFDTRARAQTDFLVVILHETADAFVPLGILVDRHDRDTVSGRMVLNTLSGEPTDQTASCPATHIIDWRFVDTLELEGGLTYRELYGRQSDRAQITIQDRQRFLIARKSEEGISPESLRVFRGVANARCDELCRVQTDTLAAINAQMPVLRFGLGRRVLLVPVSVGEYAAMYGNRAVLDLLFEQKLLGVQTGTRGLLLDSSWAGNCDTTRRLIEAGCDIECTNEGGDTPLMQAVTWDHVETVRLLLDSGASPNARDNSGQTPVFRAQSVEVADALIRAGASVDTVDETGDSCLAVQHFRGNRRVVKFLVEHGAELRYGPRGVALERRVDGRETLQEWLQSTDDTAGAKELKFASSIDYGYVLPIKSIPKKDFYREE